MPSLVHKRLALAFGGVVGAGVLFAGGVGLFGGYVWDRATKGSDAIPKASAAPFNVEVAEAPKISEPRTEAPKQDTRRITDTVRSPRTEGTKESGKEKPTLASIYLERVNKGGFAEFGEVNGDNRGSAFSGETCEIMRPVRVRAIIADSASTDRPGPGLGVVTEDVQGEDAFGPCVFLAMGSAVKVNTGSAGEYATNRAPVTVEGVWNQNGMFIEVGEQARHVDGSLGVVGEVNHHTASKTGAMLASAFFRSLDNITSIASYRVSSGDVTNPIEEEFRKRLNRPSEITFNGDTAIEFDIYPQQRR